MTDVLGVYYGNALQCSYQIADVTIKLYRQYVRQIKLEGGLFETRKKKRVACTLPYQSIT